MICANNYLFDMKTIVVYKSFTGATKQYARWLAESLGIEAKKFSAARADMDAAETVVAMSGTYCSWMPLVSFLKKNWEMIKDKKVVVIAVGIVPPADKGSEDAFNRIPAGIRAKIKFFKVPGKMGKTPPVNNFGPMARAFLDPAIEYLRQA